MNLIIEAGPTPRNYDDLKPPEEAQPEEFNDEFSKIKDNTLNEPETQPESLDDLSKSLEDTKNEPTDLSQTVMKPITDDGYNINNVKDQLQGMVDNWFRFTIDMTPEGKEKFLMLGERLAEILNIINTEFRK